jgi:hypothetical protein
MVGSYRLGLCTGQWWAVQRRQHQIHVHCGGMPSASCHWLICLVNITAPLCRAAKSMHCIISCTGWLSLHVTACCCFAAAGYPNRFRAGNAASSMWAAQNGDPNNFGAGYNPYMGPGAGRKLQTQE